MEADERRTNSELRGAFLGRAQTPKVPETGVWLRMPRDQQGRPRFVSRMDGAEAAMITGGALTYSKYE